MFNETRRAIREILWKAALEDPTGEFNFAFEAYVFGVEYILRYSTIVRGKTYSVGVAYPL